MEITKEEMDLATLIHDKTCHWNHTDGCGWMYEKWDDEKLGYAKLEYLKIARKVLKVTDAATAINVIKCLR